MPLPDRHGDVASTLPTQRHTRGAWRRAAARATEREGVIARCELARYSVTSSQIWTALRTARMFRRARGVYVLGHEHLTPVARLHVALLRAGEGAVLSDRAAAYVWGLVRDLGGPVTVTVPTQRRPKRGLVQRRRRLDARREVKHRHGLPVTSVERTIADCAGTVPDPVLAAILAEAEYRGWLHAASVVRIRAAVRGRPGAAVLRRLLDAPDPGRGVPKSRLERRWAWFARDWRLPSYRRGAHVDIGGVELRESDVVFDGTPLRIVELDAFGTHERRRATFARDRRRDRRLMAHGALTMRVTDDDLRHHEAELAEDVFRFLGDTARADAIAAGTWRPRTRRRRSV